jgi:hypothetical protein
MAMAIQGQAQTAAELDRKNVEQSLITAFDCRLAYKVTQN